MNRPDRKGGDIVWSNILHCNVTIVGWFEGSSFEGWQVKSPTGRVHYLTEEDLTMTKDEAEAVRVAWQNATAGR